MVLEPPHIDEERVRKAKRSRKILIVFIILLLAIVAAALVFWLFFMRTNVQTPANKTETTSITVSDDQSAAASGVAVTSIPDLAACVTKSNQEALKVLGSKATVDSTEASDTGSVVTVSIAPDTSTSTKSTTSIAKVYLTEDTTGVVTEVLYSVSLDSLGYENTSFKDTAEDSSFITQTLVQAGTKVSSVNLKMPAESAYQTTGKNSSGVQIVTKEDYTWTGSTELTSAPTTYELRLVFDHSMTASTKDASALERTLYLKLK